MAEFSISGRQQLADLLGDHSDAEIQELAAQIGIDHLLEQAFATMQRQFRPDLAVGQDAVVRWDIITHAGTRSYQMTVEAGICDVKPGAPPSPRVMLGLDLPDFLRLVAGQFDGMKAFMAGRLRLSGDMVFAQSVQRWFG